MIAYLDIRLAVGELSLSTADEVEAFLVAVREAVRQLHPSLITDSAVGVEVCEHAGAVPGMDEMAARLEAQGIDW